MRKIFLLFFILFIVVTGVVFLLNSDNIDFKSPITMVFGKKTEIKLINNWFVKNDKVVNNLNTSLAQSAKSALLVNFDNAELIFEIKSDERLPAGSTIKIMTALVALDSKKLDDVFSISKNAATVGEDTMGLSEGEKLTFEDLLSGLMLSSGNDAAVAIAENVAGSEDAFVAHMNEKAKLLGMNDTKFINASGLDVDGENQYTTARDLAVLSHYIWDKYPSFRKISATDHIFLDTTNTHKAYDLYNQTSLLTTYPGVRGIKPGFTWEAGYCLVTYAENNGIKLIGVILASQNRRAEMKELLDFGFAKYGITIDHPLL